MRPIEYAVPAIFLVGECLKNAVGTWQVHGSAKGRASLRSGSAKPLEQLLQSAIDQGLAGAPHDANGTEAFKALKGQPMPRLSAEKSAPRLSVLMANRNGATYLEQAIRSVLAQTLESLELILSNDGSTDDSLVIARAIDDPRLIVIDGPAQGPAAARNRALDAARGDWIAVVDADDLLHPARFERLLAQADAADLDIVADDLLHFGAGEEGRTLLAPLGLLGPTRLTAELLLQNEAGQGATVPLGYLKPVVRRSALDGLRYDETLRIGEDQDFLLRALLAGAKGELVPEGFYLYRRHAGSVSHRLDPQDADAMIAAQDRLLASNPTAAPFAALFAARRDKIARSARFERLIGDLKAKSAMPAIRRLTHDPSFVPRLARLGAARLRRARQAKGNTRKLAIGAGGRPSDLPEATEWIAVPASAQDWTGRAWAAFLARAVRPGLQVTAVGPAGVEALGYIPGWADAEVRDAPVPSRMAGPIFAPLPGDAPLVHIRTTTYKRPEALTRALQSLCDQTHDNWICDVYDDDPDGSARATVAALGDDRIRFNQNDPQRFASKNIDRCFTRNNPHSAQYFCVVEDDNSLLPGFLEANIRLCRAQNVEIVFRNQFMEFASGTPEARLSDWGILDRKFTERLYEPDHFRLALVADIGVSNGGLFWSRDAKSDLEIHEPCSATLQEYLRTFAIEDPIFVAMEPLAVWAENGADTKRDLGEQAAWFKRELSLKRSVGDLQRLAWARAPRAARQTFLNDEAFVYSKEKRAAGLVKSHLRLGALRDLPMREGLRLALRGALIRALGRPEPGVRPFLSARAEPG